ncbi:MFS transporter [Burkholderia pyrrocinia]|uniref:MFS transporter n=1 Tax=Burkholderia sp. IT-111MI5 TaxID=3026439 RepID=UPI002A27A8AE|nr:MFS transporter [Burkholderia pyrrocinia]EKS9897102.1 MFS transporter [Burkholderia pyrrocinia]EKS9909852.1 MFS transporter [Burkholderia pyrrocinia]
MNTASTCHDTAAAIADEPAPPALNTIAARIERMPPNGMHARVRVLMGLATFFDGFDSIAIASALPLLIAQWSLRTEQVGLLLSAGAVGALIGAFLFPSLAERYGRVNAVAWSSALIGATTLAFVFARSYETLVLLRVLQGIGLGGEVPIAAAYINEVTTARNRGRFVLLYELIFPVGLLAASALGSWLVPRYGWQVMYWLGTVPLFLCVLLRRYVPESPRWLASKGRLKDADLAVARFEARARTALAPVRGIAAASDGVPPAPVAPSRSKLSIVVSRAYRRRSVSVWFLWITCGFLQYGLSTWLPTIYRQVYHVPFQQSLNLALGASVLGIVGSLVCALIVDRVGRKPVIAVSLTLCALCLALAGIFHASSVYVVAGLCALAFGLMASGFITAYVYTPELYPTSVRAAGCGLASAWLKIASIVSPVVLATLVQQGRLQAAFFLFAAVPLIAAIAIARFGIETRNKTLEALEA